MRQDIIRGSFMPASHATSPHPPAVSAAALQALEPQFARSSSRPSAAPFRSTRRAGCLLDASADTLALRIEAADDATVEADAERGDRAPEPLRLPRGPRQRQWTKAAVIALILKKRRSASRRARALAPSLRRSVEARLRRAPQDEAGAGVFAGTLALLRRLSVAERSRSNEDDTILPISPSG